MEEYRRVLWTGIIIIGVIGIGFGVYYFFFHGEIESPVLVEEAGKEEYQQARGDQAPKVIAKRVPRLEGITLDKSDDLVRELAKELTLHPQASVWFKNEDLVRKFVAAVDNIGNRLSPRPNVEFLAPKRKFEVTRKGEYLCIDPASFSRYNLITEVFISLDTEECVKLYWELKPLFQEAYMELGYPTQDFHQTLLRAIVELLKTPIVVGDIFLEKKVITYMMTDPNLENLSPPQKNLLRMGAINVRKIQAKLREFAKALGFPEDELPQPVIYKTTRK